jgi:N-methylhydantoinase B
VKVAVKATKTKDRLVLDFTGTTPQTLGPVNCNISTTTAAALQAVLASTDPTIPCNHGIWDTVEFIIPPGLVISPQHPATCNHYFPTIQLVFAGVMATLGQLHPEHAVASGGFGTGAIAIGYRKDRAGKAAIFYELNSTALGGTSEHDGASVVVPMNHFTTGAPVEIVESEYPLRVRVYDVRRDSAGPGRYRGGVGYIRELEVLEDCMMTMRGSNHRFAASGLAGGMGPKASGVILNPDGPDRVEVASIETRLIKTGDILRIERSGGGGYGSPLERPPEMVLEDVRNGYVSVEAASDHYGVAIDPATLEIDCQATARLRDKRKS